MRNSKLAQELRDEKEDSGSVWNSIEHTGGGLLNGENLTGRSNNPMTNSKFYGVNYKALRRSVVR